MTGILWCNRCIGTGALSIWWLCRSSTSRGFTSSSSMPPLNARSSDASSGQSYSPKFISLFALQLSCVICLLVFVALIKISIGRQERRQSPRTAQKQDEHVEHRVGAHWKGFLLDTIPGGRLSGITTLPMSPFVLHFKMLVGACCCFGSAAKVFTSEKSIFCLSTILVSMAALISLTADSTSHLAYRSLIQWSLAVSRTFLRESQMLERRCQSLG